MKKKLEILAERLSGFVFNSNPIEVGKIEEKGNKKIAVVNLKELREKLTWNTLYFQGTAGRWATTLTLRDTFLQKDYTEKWIDGIEFYYEGKPISSDWDHIYHLVILYICNRICISNKAIRETMYLLKTLLLCSKRYKNIIGNRNQKQDRHGHFG